MYRTRRSRDEMKARIIEVYRVAHERSQVVDRAAAAIKLCCSVHFIRTICSEAMAEGLLPPDLKERTDRKPVQGNVPPAELLSRIATVRTWKRILTRNGRPAKLSLALLEQILP